MVSTATSASTPRAESSLEIDAATAKRWLDSGDAVMFDVREADERAAEWIDGTEFLPLSQFDAKVAIARAPRKVIFHCRSGKRGLDALGRFTQAGGRNAFNLAGGIGAWRSGGLAVKTGKAPPISIMRQVQIVVGTMVLVGSALAYFLANPWFLVIPAFFGAGLAFAGLTGTCGLAAFLSVMPWNRFEAPKGASCGR